MLVLGGIWLGVGALRPKLLRSALPVLGILIGVSAVTLAYFPIRKFAVDKGELWTENDELLKTKVCVIGPTVAQNLFGTEDPIGRTIRIGRAPFKIIGLFKTRGTSPFGEDQDDRVFV